ncbi:Alkaline phosphatase synthesis sensor protein PhoR [compost metagenome]
MTSRPPKDPRHAAIDRVEVVPLADEVARLETELRAAKRRLAVAQGHPEPPSATPMDLMATIVRHMPAGLAYLDEHLICRWVNPAFARVLHDDSEALVGRHLLDVLPRAQAVLAPQLKRVLETGASVTGFELPLSTHRDGHTRTSYIDLSAVPIRDDVGRVTGVLVLDVDVSERAERERRSQREIHELRELDRYKDEFLSVISHELRTPLNFIMGFASLLEDEAAGTLNDRQHEFVDKILNGADRMLVLVNDLLDVAKIKAGRLDLSPVPSPYTPLVDEVIGTLRPLAADRDITLDRHVDVPVLPCLDAGRILQVLTNLVNNGIKFTPPGGQVTVRAFVEDGELITQVTDTGVGIAPEDLPKLFERFRQLDMSATRSAGGTGLGLAISKALVEAHGGQIGVLSEEGQGSTFWFSLPIACEGEG